MDNTFHKSPRNTLTYYFLTSGLNLIIEIIIFTILFYLWNQFNWWHFIIYIYFLLWG
ncbi:PH domain-containing protein, partial [Staphylococcus warneri]